MTRAAASTCHGRPNPVRDPREQRAHRRTAHRWWREGHCQRSSLEHVWNPDELEAQRRNRQQRDLRLEGRRGTRRRQRDHINRSVNPQTVRVHDNYIHHNQHWETQGYGVGIGYGAYALIEQNVFDYNRHAIASDGSDGSGYFAYRNLVLPHGGLNRSVLGVKFYTHQFDMHGRENYRIFAVRPLQLWPCRRVHGHSRQYVPQHQWAGFKLRDASDRADLAANVFGHLWGVTAPASAQDEAGLHA